MARKLSQFGVGGTVAAGDQVVGLQGGVNVRWTFTQVLAFIRTQLQLAGGAYVDYVPTIAASTPAGSGWAVTLNHARYHRVGRMIHALVSVTITNLGTGPAGSGNLDITAPFTAATAAQGCGTENALTGRGIQVNISAGSNVMTAKFHDSSTLLTVGNQVRLSIQYEATD